MDSIEKIAEKMAEKREGFSKNDFYMVMTSIAISSKEFVRKDIDKIFNENKLQYINEYKNSIVYNMNILSAIPYDTEVYVERVLGIFVNSIKTGDYTNIITLYKQRFKKLYNNLKNRKTIVFKDIHNFFTKGDTGNYEVISTFFVFNLLGKLDKKDLEYTKVIDLLVKPWFVFEIYKEHNYSESIINFQRGDIDKIKEKLDIKNKSYQFKELLDDIIDSDVKELENLGYKLTKFELVKLAYKIGKRSKNIGVMNSYLNFLNIYEYEFARDIYLTKKDIDDLIASFIYSKKHYNFTDDDLYFSFIVYLYMYIIGREYKNLKADYLKNVNEDYLIEVEELKNKLKKSSEELKKSEESFKSKENILYVKEKELEEENNSLKTEVKALESKLKEYELLKQEVIKLRELSFKENNSTDDMIRNEENRGLSDEELETLNNMKIAVVGGDISWVKKMKDIFTSWSFINVDNLNNDLSLLKNYDLILINVKMTHSLYFKIKSIIDKYNLQYDYINVPTNVDLSLNEIHETVKKYYN